MALRTSVIDIPLDGGMDEATDDYKLTPPAMLSVKNGVYDKAGRIRKRNGYRELSRENLPTTGIGVPNSLFSHKNQLCVHTSEGVYALSEENESWQDTTDGGPWPCKLTSRPAVRSGVNSLHHDTAVANGFVCVVWETKHGDTSWGGVGTQPTVSKVWCMITEEVSGNIAVFPTLVQGITSVPRVVAVDDVFMITGLDDEFGVATGVSGLAINSASLPLSVGVAAPRASVATAIVQYELEPGDGAVYLVLGETGAVSLPVEKFSTGWVSQGTTSVGLPAEPGFGVQYSAADDGLLVGAVTGGNLNACFVDSTPTAFASFVVFATSITENVAIAAQRKSAADTRVMWFLSGTIPETVAGASADQSINVDLLQWAESDISGLPGTRRQQYWLRLATKAWVPPIGPVMVGVRTTTNYGDPYSTGEATGKNVVSGSTRARRTLPLFSHGYSVGLIVSPYSRGLPPEHHLRVIARFHQSKIDYDTDDHAFLTHVTAREVDDDSYLFTRTVRLRADTTKYAGGNTGGLDAAANAYINGGGSGYEIQKSLDSPFFGETFTGGDTVLVDLYPGPIRSKDYGDAVVLSGGLAGFYDGHMCTEIAPNSAPPRVRLEFQTSARAGGTGTSVEASYCAIYFWEDAAGNIHRSAPSPVGTPHIPQALETHSPSGALQLINSAGGGYEVLSVLVKAPLPSGVDGLYDRRMYIGLYRKVDPTSVFHLGAGNATFPDDNKHESGQFHLDCVVPVRQEMVDARGEISITPGQGLHGCSGYYLDFEDLATKPFLYTAGGVLASEAPPALHDVLVANGRVFGISGEDPNTVWYTKPLAAGIAPEFNGSLTIYCPAEGGDLIGLAALDEKVVLFKQRRLYIVTGDGASALGTTGGFSPPQLIAGDVGCVEKNSIVEGPFGVMFKAERGFFLLDRSLQVKFIGAQMQDIQLDANGDHIGIHSAVLNTDANEVRFGGKSASGGGITTVDRVFVYNYLYNKWSYFDGLDAVHACLWDGGYTRITRDWYPYTESGYLDEGTLHIPLEIITPWIRPATDQAYCRFKRARFLTQRTTDDLEVLVGYDYKSTYDTTLDITDWSQAVDHVLVHIPRQKAAAVRFKLTCTDPAVGPRGEGIRITGLSLDVGTKKGLHKNVPPTARN